MDEQWQPREWDMKDDLSELLQHEYDHLQGKLFTDYILEYELPLYDDSTGKFKEIDRKIAEKF